MTTIKVSRIAALVLPQLWRDDANKWMNECSVLLDDMKKALCEPSFIPPNMGQWPSTMRPEPRSLPHDDTVPLFGWLRMASALNSTETYRELSKRLFRLLLRCGADNIQKDDLWSLFINALNVAKTRVTWPVELIATEFPQLAGYTLAFETALEFRQDATAAILFSTMSTAERESCVKPPRAAWLLAAALDCHHTLFMMWKFLRRVMTCDEMPYTHQIHMISRVDAKQDYRYGLLALIGNTAHADVWSTFTDTRDPFIQRFLAIEKQPPFSMGLEDVSAISGAADAPVSERDSRMAFFVPWTNAAALSNYDGHGLTPVMRAAKEGLSMTLDALLDRADEIDLLVPVINSKRLNDLILAPDALKPGKTDFSQRLAMHLMGETFANTLVGTRLAAETQRQVCRLPASARFAVQVWHSVGMPRELMRLCLDYSSLPSPAVWPTAIPVVVADNDDEPAPKRQRLD